MTTRRRVLAGSTVVVFTLAGCTEQSRTPPATDTTSEATPAKTHGITDSPATASSTARTEADDATTSATTTDSTTDTPVVNGTSYSVAWEWDLTGPALGDDLDPRWNALTSDDWQSVVDEAVLSAKSRSFLGETDFEAESVIAFQVSVGDLTNRLELHSVEGIGTETVTLAVDEVVSEGGGANVEVPLLLLVRVPNRGTEPTEVEITAPQTTTAG